MHWTACTLVLIFSASAAQAQNASTQDSDSTLIFAVVRPICMVETARSEAVVQLVGGVSQAVTTVSYTCNGASGFTRRVTSRNAGSLLRGRQRIPYRVSESGDARLAYGPIRLVSPLVTQIAAFPQLTLGAHDFLSVTLPSIPAGLLAGEYSDTITIEIAPN